MKSAVLAAALSIIVPASAFADPQSARPAVAGRAARPSHHPADPLHLQLARAVFPRERWERQVSQASLELTQQLTVASRGHFQLDPDFADRLREEYERMAPYEELVHNQALILDRQYTPAEQRQLLAFYRSPLGKKSVLLIHDLTTYSDREMQQRVHAGIGDVLSRLKPLVHALPDTSAPEGDSPTNEAAPREPHVSSSDEVDAREI